MSIDIGGLIIGVIALIGSLHYSLASSLLQNLSEIGAKFLSKEITIEINKEKEKIIKNCRGVFAFIAISNHIVELVFSFLFSYACFSVLTHACSENNQKSSLLKWYIIIIILGLMSYIFVFTRVFIDFDRIRKYISCWFPEKEQKKRFGLLLNFLIVVFVILLLILLLTYFVTSFLFFFNWEIKPIKSFFIFSTIVAFAVWWSSFILKPLTKMFEIRLIVFSKSCKAGNQK